MIASYFLTNSLLLQLYITCEKQEEKVEYKSGETLNKDASTAPVGV